MESRMEMNLMNQYSRHTIAASMGNRAEDGTIPQQSGPQEIGCKGNGLKLFPPSRLLWAPMSHDPRNGAMKKSDHSSSTVSEPQICRICDLDEEENDDDILVELGCNCKGQMSKMHRKCILKWFGVRMLLEKRYKCELCKTVLHPRAQLIVARGVSDHDNEGRVVLMQALKSSLASYAPHIDVELAATYQELVHLLRYERADWYRHQRHQRQAMVHIDIEAPAVSSSVENHGQPLTLLHLQANPCGVNVSVVALAVAMGITTLGVGLFTFLTHHFYGNAAFH